MRNTLLSLLIIALLAPFSLHAAGEKVSTIVIDPGHGGKDAGAVGKNCYEKDIALKVALKFGELINQNFPDVKVIYTRKDDRFVELRQRGRIANQNHADLFVSIHCNSTEGKEAKGVETWIMGNHKNDANLKVAQLENSAILQENNHEENYDNFDPNSPDAYIIFSLYQNAFMDQSLGFAAKIQDQYGQRVPSPNRGIKQAGFLVLWACALPSVLTEIGFISNPTEEKFLNSEDGQLKIATSLFNAFKEYKYQVEGFNNQAEVKKPTDIPSAASVLSDTAHTQPVAESPAPEQPTEPAKPEQPATPVMAAPDTVQAEAVIESPAPDLAPEAVQPAAPGLVFKIQFASSSTDKPLDAPEFKNLNLPVLSKYEDNGLFKYCCGEADTPEAAQPVLRQVQEAGFKDAFMVVFSNGRRISTQEAYRILQERNK